MGPVRISDAIRDIAFNPQLSVAEAVDRYYAPELTHISDGRTLDHAGFVQMVTGMRSRGARGEVTVLDEMYNGPHYAERHRYRITLTDGSVNHREIFYFATLAKDGRFLTVHETGFDVDN